ncbi:MAG: hypothetical protein PHD36_09800 [Desulfotomaculaceae bacterium]|nr:hypothetical protein [Desulfotomaculaceae bacterium]
MLLFLFALLAWVLVIIFVKKPVTGLWTAGFIGITIVAIADYTGISLNLYYYPGGIFYMGGIPLFLLLGTYAASILYLYWLPRQWRERFLYTAYVSVLFLAVEAVVYSLGGIAYPNWKLWYSYFLLVAGLTVLAASFSMITSPAKIIDK